MVFAGLSGHIVRLFECRFGSSDLLDVYGRWMNTGFGLSVTNMYIESPKFEDEALKRRRPNSFFHTRATQRNMHCLAAVNQRWW
jgi:hypothetical protein